MAARSSWRGFIRLSLVSVPVKAYTANNSSADISLHQLHQGCNNRVKYRKTCPEHGEIKGEQIVKGYEYAKGEYVIIDKNEIDKLRTESDHSLQIDGFIDSAAVDPIYHSGKTYYLVPDGAVGQKPYALLMRAMTDRKLTDLLIGATTLPSFDLTTYKGTYTEKLTRAPCAVPGAPRGVRRVRYPVSGVRLRHGPPALGAQRASRGPRGPAHRAPRGPVRGRGGPGPVLL